MSALERMTAEFDTCVISIERDDSGLFVCENVHKRSGGRIMTVWHTAEDARGWFDRYVDLERDVDAVDAR